MLSIRHGRSPSYRPSPNPQPVAVTVQFTGYSLHNFRSREVYPRPAHVTMAKVQQVVSGFYKLPLAEMTSARRARAVARPRQVAMYLCRCHTARSLPEIGRKFGGRDHTTVIHAIRVVERLIQEDPEISEDVATLRRLLVGSA